MVLRDRELDIIEEEASITVWAYSLSYIQSLSYDIGYEVESAVNM
jgi:hypothetical protein